MKHHIFKPWLRFRILDIRLSKNLNRPAGEAGFKSAVGALKVQ